jgi:radical SAM superfamily enzyme YgiQ (UPF0313 family)
MVQVVLYNPAEKTKFRVPYLPFSLMTVGSALRSAGFDTRIVDARVQPNAREIVGGLLGHDTLFFGITLITGSGIWDALETAKYVKARRPDISVVLGGVHASLLPEQSVLHPYVDLVVIGHGERTAVEVARRIEKGQDLSSIPDIAYKVNGKAFVTTGGSPFYMIDHEMIDYEMVDLRQYIKTDATGKRCMDYLSSRGCPHPCSYCAISKLWKRKMLFYPAKEMVENMEHFQENLDIDSIHFLDDNFFVNRERVETFCDEVLSRKLSLRFWSMCRIEYFVRYEDVFLRKLREAGFSTMNFGAESGSQFILDRIRKGHTVEQILETARKCQHHGFRGQFSFMMGFPFERKADLDHTFKLIDAIHATNSKFDIQLFPYTPFPGTELADECLQYGYTHPDRLEDWARFEFGCTRMPWLSGKLKRRIDTMTTIAWFAFTSETAIKLGGIKGRLFEMLGKIARLRWKYRMFALPVEWKIVNLLAKR